VGLSLVRRRFASGKLACVHTRPYNRGMHRIAIFSDIHANLPALRAILADVEGRKIDSIYCLGDLVDFAPWPNEVIELIRQHRIPTLMGNHDARIAFDEPVFPLAKHEAVETAARIQAVDFTRNAVTPDNKRFLGGLPAQIRLVFHGSGGETHILLVHASPRSIDEYLYEDHSAEELAGFFTEHRADVLVMGHTHRSYIRRVALGDGRSGLALNTGSIGRTKEEAAQATYLLLTVDDGSVEAEIVRISYPVHEVIEAIHASEVPNFYADFLKRKVARTREATLA
jgi:predicted phosphodiesterase